MIGRLKDIFSPSRPREATGFGKHRIELAVAVLLFEVSRADDSISGLEVESIAGSLQKTFRIDAGELNDILTEAEREVEQSVSLFPFTRQVNETFSRQQKKQVIEALWRVAFADGELDRYENQIIRRIADLLYLGTADIMQARHRAERGG